MRPDIGLKKNAPAMLKGPGRFDGFWEEDLQYWDVAAGMLLVREAGGFVTDFRGGDRMVDRSEFLAANDQIHNKLHKLVAKALRG